MGAPATRVYRSFAILSALALIILMGGQIGLRTAKAADVNPATDTATIPHYFGPWPNWALSPLTLPTATVSIDPAPGDTTGAGATAVATVDPVTGAVASFTVTNAGGGYTTAPIVTVTGGNNAATAAAVIDPSSIITGFTSVDPGTGGYTGFDVVLTGGLTAGGEPADPATGIGSGGVDNVIIDNPGKGYSQPTVDFDMPDSPDGVQATGHPEWDADGIITNVVIDNPGSGYLTAPGVTIRNGTQYDPVNLPADGIVATAHSTVALSAVNVVNFGSGYEVAPTVEVLDTGNSGTGATATPVMHIGAVTSVVLTNGGGDGYLNVGIRKFVDNLPGLCVPGQGAGCPVADNKAPTMGQKAIPVAVPEKIKYDGVEADQYVIGVVQYRSRFSSDLPPSLVRGYVQLETPGLASVSQHIALTNASLDPTADPTPILDADNNPVLALTSPHYLGPVIAATKDKPVRIIFKNLLPTGAEGDLYLPTDSSLMGSGTGPEGDPMAPPVQDPPGGTVLDDIRNPVCAASPKPVACFKDNRATLHLHGGVTPWISDGTPHQWITPAGENTPWPEGVSVRSVPDMTAAGCDAADDGCMTFYYTNQQSARLMFYHDHAWGITRLNVYAGEAAGYLITDDTEKRLISTGAIPGANSTIPLIIQDKTFVPSEAQIHGTGAPNFDGAQDPTWDTNRWGGEGNFWYHHVYMPAQNPGDPSGMSAYGRWMYGPWFWPPASGTIHPPIANPYYDPACNLDDPATWTYQTDPFCEPELIPGTPNISTGMEQFNDTPLVNGVAYPKVTLDPKPYRLRILNAANDRFFNLQWYQPDPNQGNGATEVKLNPIELAAAQTDPNVSPTPDRGGDATKAPDWVQIGTEGGFLPAPTVVDGQQPTTWITDPTRFDVGNVDKHSLLLAPAERADAIVDFSKYRGKTFILYNDAPAAFPARVSTYDYYTGAPDLSPTGAPTIMPGYGPNTRTIMQVTIADTEPAQEFSVSKLRSAFTHKSNGSGAFEAGQPPVIVGQAAYNSAYGTSFASSGNCNGSTSTRCDGFVRINDTANFAFNTLKAPMSKLTLPLQPKAIHDEMNSSTFDEFGRMQANLGVEAQPPTPGLQNVTLYPYVNPQTEVIDGTNLPRENFAVDADTGLPVDGVNVSPIGSATDGTQLWRITHNGVDTHPIHFHLYDVQVLNRVTWDNIIIPTEPSELGWKDTVRISPLEDTIVALRPIIPKLPFELPNAVRALNPMDPLGSTTLFNQMTPQGNAPAAPITNELVNFGWEYVYHCHILSHEEMDMMRPVSLAMPPVTPDGLELTPLPNNGGVQVAWNDNSIAETAQVVQRSTDGNTWTTVQTLPTALTDSSVHNTAGDRPSITDATGDKTFRYRVVAENAVGYNPGGTEFPSVIAKSTSEVANWQLSKPLNVVGSSGAAQGAVDLVWDPPYSDGGFAITSYEIQRSPSTGTPVWTASGTSATTSATVTGLPGGSTWIFRVRAINAAPVTGPWSDTSAPAIASFAAPGAPTGVTGTAGLKSAQVSWTAPVSDGGRPITGYMVEYSSDSGTNWTTFSANTGVTATTINVTSLTAETAYIFRVSAINSIGVGAASTPSAAVTPYTVPGAPTGVSAARGAKSALVSWSAPASDGASPITGYRVEYSANGGSSWINSVSNTGTNATSFTVTGLANNTSYIYRVSAWNIAGRGAVSASSAPVLTFALPGSPTGVAGTPGVKAVTLTWTAPVSDGGTPVTGYRIEQSADNGTSWVVSRSNTGTTATSYTATGLLSGTTYIFRVSAFNAAGMGAASTASAPVITFSVPGSPTNVSGVAGVKSVTVSWTAPVATGGTPITGYRIEYSSNSGASWSVGRSNTGSTATSYTVGALTTGTGYIFRVSAINAAGTGVPSASSGTVTPN